MKSNGATPLIFTIFGITGDLSQRKLIPALFDLYDKKLLPSSFRILGFARRPLSAKEFELLVKNSLSKKVSAVNSEKFFSHLEYIQGNFEDATSFIHLREKIVDLDMGYGMCSNRLFHLAVPPSLYENILLHLATSGLTEPCNPGESWARVLIEKPFGKDIVTAKKLDQLLGKLFKEEQVFRIDHYLGKETIQNILMFRFSNSLFEPIWDNNHIEKVHVQIAENFGINNRGTFYDGIGALRDIGQNHLLQMLAAIAMENPHILDAAHVRKEREKVFTALRPMTGNDTLKYTTRGQYHGYLKEKDVAPDSKTETYFKLEAYIDNKRWKHVPIILENGKMMSEYKTEITVYFKSRACLCPKDTPHEPHQNILTFHIYPEEKITIRFWAKKPGFTGELEQKDLSFTYEEPTKTVVLPSAYEKVLYDCIKGDQTTFLSTEEILASWRYITPILNSWHKTPLIEYTPQNLKKLTKT